MLKELAIVWSAGSSVDVQEVRIEVTNGRLLKRSEQAGGKRIGLAVECDEYSGTGAAIVAVTTEAHAFSFFAEHVCSDYPIYMPLYGAAVTELADDRSCEQIGASIADKGQLSSLQRMRLEPEASFEEASLHTLDHACSTWLGISRDTRLFEMQLRGRGSNNFWASPVPGQELQWDWVQPRQHGEEVGLPENGGNTVRYVYMAGRGIGCTDAVERRLEAGVLPILNVRIRDDDVIYDGVSFVSLETSVLEPSSIDGTPYLLADGYGYGHMHTAAMKERRDALLAQEALTLRETTVYCCRITARNTAHVPRFAWFKNPLPNAGAIRYTFVGERGLAQYSDDRVFCRTTMNGKPLRREEHAVLLKPGETAVFEFYLPHEPISRERAVKLDDFDSRLAACRRFWERKLAAGAQISLPERRIQEMAQAGLLHLDLILYGQEPSDTLVPAIGIYTAIGSESAPIIQYFDSVGWHSVARRALTFFLDKQHEDGLMQNFGGYMLETGAVLWSIGEHYRYTRDDSWVVQIKEKLVKAYNYLLQWRRRNETEALRGRGYGMLEGKTADPEDPYHSFMLNGYAYMGLCRLSETLAATDPALSDNIRLNAAALKRDIRDAFNSAVARSPVVPIGDGSWVPTAPPWVEARGPVSLFAEGGSCFTHGTFTGRDSLLGPLYLIFQEIIAPDEPAADYLMQYHCELMHSRNVAFSQPYYSMHPWAHLKRGEVKPFLKAYYNAFAGLADRETYSFWEHFYQVSPHKTHEEGWFLMQTRWMLYMEEGDTLNLLPGIPRRWLSPGQTIEISRMVSYFGAFSLHVRSSLDGNIITANVEFHEPSRMPEKVKLRLPHPEGRNPSETFGGVFVNDQELVEINTCYSLCEIKVIFNT